MQVSDIENCIKIAACVCGKDGVISEAEERLLVQTVLEHCPELNAATIQAAFDDFFESDCQIETYLQLVENEDSRQFALSLAEISASADGLDIRENIALQKAYIFWGVKNHA